MSNRKLPHPTDSLTTTANFDPKRKKSRLRRATRNAAIVLASAVALATISTVANAGVTASEKNSITPYGHKVSIEAGDINVYRNGGTGPTMVFLSGYGTPAPAIDFAPLVRQLDAFDVIVIEGFGYGYSDHDVRNRTVKNITSEIHEVLGRLHVQSPVILVGHSVGGLYMRYYANAYPGQVSAIIGIDPMAATRSSLKVGDPSIVEGIQNTLGLMRWVTTIAPDLVQPPGTAYTKDDRKRTAAMTVWNYGNVSISDEWSRIGANSTKASEQPLPANVPVLEFLSTESVKTIPGWLEKHTAELEGVTTHQLVILEGAHYLHWTQASALAQTMSEFISAHVTN
jgi:pimeloyl-ACP methyl ester carboxylesterase